MDFGKNRVQYKDFFWQYYRFKTYDCYYYQGGEELAIYTGKKAAEYLPQLQSSLEYTLEDPLQFIVYNTHSDFKQSNIGLNGDETSNIGGTTRIVGNKVFVYYEGDHAKLDQQIRAGIASVIVQQMMYGGSIREMVRNSTLLTLPDWYLPGLVSYLGEGWSQEIDNQVRDGVLSGAFDKFYQLEGNQARVAGHSIWNYIAEVYGEKVITNILYMTRVTRNVESGFLYVLGLEMPQLTSEYMEFYRKKYSTEESLRKAPEIENLDITNKKQRVYQQFRLSPDGKTAAYSTNQLGQYRVYLYDIESGKSSRIAGGEHKMNRLTDYSFPILAWSPDGSALAYITEKKGKVLLNFYYTQEKKISSRQVFQLEKVVSMDYSNDGKQMIFSGVYQGKTDLYRYYIVGNRQEALTNDVYDDLQAKFVNNDKDIVFVSNRPNDTINQVPAKGPLGNKDVYVMSLQGKGSKLERITNTPEENEEQPSEYGYRKFTYISNKNGVVNRFFAQYDSTIESVDTTINYRYYSSIYPLSNFNRNVLEYDVNVSSDRYSVLMYADGGYNFYRGKISEDSIVSLAEIRISGLKSIKQVSFDDPDKNKDLKGGDNPDAPAGGPETYKVPSKTDDLNKEVDINNYQFGEAKPAPVKPVTADTLTLTGNNQAVLDKMINKPTEPAMEKRNYNINFATDQVLTQVDNTYNNQFYQLYTGPDNINPGLSGFFKLGASDLFEDYKIVGGFRTAISLGNMDYMLSFQDLKGRVDKTYFGQRQSQLFANDYSIFKVITYSGFYEQKYPVSEVAAFKASGSIRYDQAVALSTNQDNLLANNLNQYQFGLKGEYVYDNTLKRGTNLYNGTRAKFWVEGYKSPGKNPQNAFTADTKKSTYVIGLDARHYEKIHRSLILATRLSASTSFGSRKVLYYLGGLDRWLYLPASDQSTPLPSSDQFFYQALAAPLRGSLKNVRNGNSFALVNAELRWPIFKYLSDRPLRSDFLESFQVVAFTDIGTAWTGKSPYADDNQFNVHYYGGNGNPIAIKVYTQRDPIVAGYGMGLRGRVLGYFMRADWAWSVQDGQPQPREFYLSLSLDF